MRIALSNRTISAIILLTSHTFPIQDNQTGVKFSGSDKSLEIAFPDPT